MPVSGHTHEEIVGIRVRPADLEEFHQVVELTVDVAADGDGAFLHMASTHDLGDGVVGSDRCEAWLGRSGWTYNRLHIRLFLQHLTCLDDKVKLADVVVADRINEARAAGSNRSTDTSPISTDG
jgi:hypothetical protein